MNLENNPGTDTYGSLSLPVACDGKGLFKWEGSWETFIDHLMNRGVDTVIILQAFLGDKIKDHLVRKMNKRVRRVEPKGSEPFRYPGFSLLSA